MLRSLFLSIILFVVVLPLNAQDSGLRFNVSNGLVRPFDGRKHEMNGYALQAGVEYAHRLSERLAVYSGLNYQQSNFSKTARRIEFTTGFISSSKFINYNIVDVRRRDAGITLGLEYRLGKFLLRPKILLSYHLDSRVDYRLVSEQIQSEQGIETEFILEDAKPDEFYPLPPSSGFLLYDNELELTAGLDVLFELAPGLASA